MGASRRAPKVHGTHYWSLAFHCSRYAIRVNMPGDERFGTKGSALKVGFEGKCPRYPEVAADESSRTALQEYDYRISSAVEELLQVIKTSEGQPINMTNFSTYFAFDVMEDLTFNQSTNMVRHGKTTHILKAIRQDMYGIALSSHLPWFLPLVKRTPIINRNYLDFWDCIQQKIDQRRMVCL